MLHGKIRHVYEHDVLAGDFLNGTREIVEATSAERQLFVRGSVPLLECGLGPG